MTKQKNKYCSTCSLHGNLNTKGLDAVVEQISHKNPSCDWYVNSAEYNYCFWNMLKDINGYQMSEKEICQLLCITPLEMQEALNSAMNKIKNNLHNPDIALFIEDLMEKSNNNHDYHNVPEEVKMYVYSNEFGARKIDEEEEESEKPKRGRPKKGFGQPIHQAGKRVDIYFSGKKNAKKKHTKK